MPPKHVLIAEDNASDRDLITMAFAAVDSEARVTCVKSGEELLAFFDNANINELAFTLVDYHMPGLSGEELLTRISNDIRLLTLPVIVFSGSKDPADVIASYQLGASAFVSKPVDYDGYERAVRAITNFWQGINVTTKAVVN